MRSDICIVLIFTALFIPTISARADSAWSMRSLGATHYINDLDPGPPDAVDVAFDPFGNIGYVHTKSSTNVLLFTTIFGDGHSTTETVMTGTVGDEYGEIVSLDLEFDDIGIPGIAVGMLEKYFDQNNQLHTRPLVLFFTKECLGDWGDPEIVAFHEPNAVTSNGLLGNAAWVSLSYWPEFLADRPVVSYILNWYDLVSGNQVHRGEVGYSNRAPGGTTWSTVTVSGTEGTGSTIDSAVNSSSGVTNRLNLVFAKDPSSGNDEIRWVQGTLSAVASNTVIKTAATGNKFGNASLVLDPSASFKPKVAFIESLSSKLIYYTSFGTSWSSPTLVASGSAGQLGGLVVDNAGTPRIVRSVQNNTQYHDDRSVYISAGPSFSSWEFVHGEDGSDRSGVYSDIGSVSDSMRPIPAYSSGSNMIIVPLLRHYILKDGLDFYIPSTQETSVDYWEHAIGFSTFSTGGTGGSGSPALSDSFSDNNYTSNPAWSTSGTWSASTGQRMEHNSLSGSEANFTNSTSNSDFRLRFRYQILTGSTAAPASVVVRMRSTGTADRLILTLTEDNAELRQRKNNTFTTLATDTYLESQKGNTFECEIIACDSHVEVWWGMAGTEMRLYLLTDSAQVLSGNDIQFAASANTLAFFDDIVLWSGCYGGDSPCD